MNNYDKFPIQFNKLLDYGPVMIEATLENATTVNLTNETPINADEDFAAVILVRKDGAELEILGKTPFAEAEAFFHKYLDALRSKGDRPVITYCSFD